MSGASSRRMAIFLRMIDPVTASIGGLTVVGSKLAPTAAKGLMSFLGRICNPAADELGALLADKVASVRQRNAAALLEKTQSILEPDGAATALHTPPRVAYKILEHGSWIDEDLLRDLWSGLLASSCTASGDDDSNMLFTSLLEDMTSLQAKILAFGSQRSVKLVDESGLVGACPVSVSLPALQEITGCVDIQRLDRELDCMRERGLLSEGGFTFSHGTKLAIVTPTALGIQLWCRCQGSRSTPADFFTLTHVSHLSGIEVDDNWLHFDHINVEPTGYPF